MTPKERGAAEGEDPTFHSHGDGLSPCSMPHSTSSRSEPLTFFEHSISLLSPLAGPDMPGVLESHVPSLLSFSMGGETGHGQGREESPIVPRPSWDGWTQANSHCQRKNTPPSSARD